MKRYKLVENGYSDAELNPIEKVFSPIVDETIKYDWKNVDLNIGGGEPEKIRYNIKTLCGPKDFKGKQFVCIVKSLCNMPKYDKYFFKALTPKSDLDMRGKVFGPLDLVKKSAITVANLCGYFIMTRNLELNDAEIDDCSKCADSFSFNRKYLYQAWDSTSTLRCYTDEDSKKEALTEMDILYMGMILAIMVAFHCAK